MNRQFELVPLVLVAACSACNAPDSEWQVALNEVVAAERGFAAQATSGTVQAAFVANMDGASTIFRPGPVKAVAWMEANPFPDDFALEWAPAWADVSADGNLGVTTGPYRAGRRGTGKYGSFGQYLTVWRRTPTGFVAALDWGIAHEQPSDSAALDRAAEPAAADGPAGDGPALRIADEDLNAVLASGGAAAWRNYVAGNVRWLRDGVEPAFGVERIPPVPAGATYVSIGAVMADSGDFGYTWGEQRMAVDSAAGPDGFYVRIWRIDADGSWNVVVDGVAGA